MRYHVIFSEELKVKSFSHTLSKQEGLKGILPFS